MYRVNHQCCLGENRPETPLETHRRGSLVFFAKSLAKPDKIKKKNEKKYIFRKFCLDLPAI